VSRSFMPTRLTDIKVSEQAFVDRGDNNPALIRFWKRDPSEGESMPTPEEVKKAHEGELAKRDTEIATLKSDLDTTKQELAKSVAEVAKLKTPPADPRDALPPEMRKRLDESDARAEKLEKELREERETRRTAEFEKRAEALGAVPGMTTGEVASMLKSLPVDSATKLEQSLRASVAQARENTLLKRELGRGGESSANGVEGVMAKVEVLAKAYVAAHPDTTIEVARYQVMQSGEGAKLFNEARAAEQTED